MKTIYIIELIIVGILFLMMIIAMFMKRTKKLRIAVLVISINLCILGHIGISYYQEEPILILKGEHIIKLEANQDYEDMGVIATYHEKNVVVDVKQIGEVDTSKPGTYQIQYQYYYKKNKIKQVERTIEVIDNIAPKITLKGKTEMTILSTEKYKEPGYTVEDNVDKDLFKKVKTEKKEIDKTQYKIIYTVEDSSGNIATVERIVKIKKVLIKKENKSSTNATNTNTTNKTNTNISNVNSASTSTANSGVIYLTFDDGPSADITPKILNILKQENVKATFFILNYSSGNEYLVKRIVNEGHTIGIHGYSHDYKNIYKSVDSYMNNLIKLQEKIKTSTGVTTNITRFPGGSSNTISSFNPKIMTKLTKEVKEKGFIYYDWNVSSGDAGGAKNKDQVYNNVVKGLKRNRNNIVLMHDFASNNKTLNALTDIIQYGKKNGYTFQNITQKTPEIHHAVNN